MALPSPRLLLALLLLCALSAPAQRIENILNAPFIAEIVSTRAHEEKSYQDRIHIARASNGSTYRSNYNSAGTLTRVDIDDVPNNRHIVLYPPLIPGQHSHTYTLDPPPDDKFSTPSVEEVRDRLRRQQASWSEHPDRERDDQLIHDTSLGERPGDGMTLFGFHGEITHPDGSKTNFEYWQSDWGIMVSDRHTMEDHEFTSRITHLRHEEPDPSLFEIPKEYLSDPLLDANTIFIDNQSGSPQLPDYAASAFNSWRTGSRLAHVKPLTIVNNKAQADLIAVFTSGAVDEGSSAAGMKLEIFLRDAQAPAFEETHALDNSQSAESFAVRQCVGGFWNRLSSTHVGLRNQAFSRVARTP